MPLQLLAWVSCPFCRGIARIRWRLPQAPWLSTIPHACRYAAHFLAVNGVAVLTSVLALARPPFQVIRYALAALEAVTRVCGPAGCDVSPALAWHILHLRERLPFCVTLLACILALSTYLRRGSIVLLQRLLLCDRRMTGWQQGAACHSL